MITFEPRCTATTIGSLPHTDPACGTALMFESTPEIPSWVQFPKRVSCENMMIQFTEGMPGLVKDGDRVYFDTAALDWVEQALSSASDREIGWKSDAETLRDSLK